MAATDTRDMRDPETLGRKLLPRAQDGSRPDDYGIRNTADYYDSPSGRIEIPSYLEANPQDVSPNAYTPEERAEHEARMASSVEVDEPVEE